MLVSKVETLTSLLESTQSFLEEEYTVLKLGVIVSPIELETKSFRLLAFLVIDELYLEGLISSINLIFFSELKKPRLGDFRSLNLKVLAESSS
jgi:hypothetical protein